MDTRDTHDTPDTQATRPIRFFHRGQVVEISGAHPTRTVLEWLREDARCTGTKEGCNEGDCGACTVVIGELATAGDKAAVRGLSLNTVNACIQFLPTLDGKALFTVEDLKLMMSQRPQADAKRRPPPEGDESPWGGPAPTQPLHPVQQAMVECHGSQCGFCTPGFVMSLWSTYEHHSACATQPSRQQLADDLSGNLCRCTGYRPILDAGQRMFDLPPAPLDTAPAIAALRQLQSAEGFDYAAGTERFHAPKTLDALASLREQKPTAQLLAGSTDVGLWVNKQFRALGDILYVGEVAELKRIEVQGDQLVIGAGASLEAAWRALAQRWPSLTEVWLRFASPPIRNAGTMGGNVANGSPIGDSPPVLMALDASIALRKGARVRSMPLAEFYLDYMKNQLEAGEFVLSMSVPLAGPQRSVRAYKISKRFDCDISALCAAFAIELDAGVVRSLRLAFGGMAATVKRAAKTEAALIGQPWTQASVDAAKAVLATEFAPLSDMRASAAYRGQVVQNLLQRFWLETRANDPLAATETSVWSVMPHELALQGD